MSPKTPRTSRPTLGIILIVLTTIVFAVQDGISRYLAENYNVLTIVMIRYWFFALFVVALSHYRGGVCAIAKTSQPVLQIGRGVLLVVQIYVAVWAFTLVGLVEFQAVFASYPLTITALSALFLGERVGWRRWAAVVAGLCGVVIAIWPSVGFFDLHTILPVVSAICFAAYGVLTRYAARRDSAETSFFWTGVGGAIGVSLIGPFFGFHLRASTGSGWRLSA